MERKPFYFRESFSGNWPTLENALKNPKTVWVWDMDGILINSPEEVLKDFSKKFNILVKPSEINDFNFLTDTLRKNGFDEASIKQAEDGWFDPQILGAAKRELFIKPIIRKTIKKYGPERNLVLTSRIPRLRDVTFETMKREFPEIPTKNILMRDIDTKAVNASADYKVEQLKEIASKAPWVIFVDDHTGFAKAVVSDGIPNCLVINIPLGKTLPDFENEKLFVMKRYPEEEQGMYTLWYALHLV